MTEYGLLPFGSPIPDDPHAISVSIPEWEHMHVVCARRPGSAVPEAIRTGYPRLFVHRKIRELSKLCTDEIKSASAQFEGAEIEAFLFPSAGAAYEGLENIQTVAREKGAEDKEFSTRATIVHFVAQYPTSDGEEELHPELHALVVPSGIYWTAHGFWRMSGSGISSRYAVMVLERLKKEGSLTIVKRDRESPSWLNVSPGALEQKSIIRERIADLLNGDAGSGTGRGEIKSTDVFLYPKGVSTVWHTEKMARALFPELKVVTFGYHFICCLHLHESCRDSSVTFPSDDLLTELPEFLKTTRISALFAEVPNNGLMKTPNLTEIRKLADQYGFLVVIDDTIGGFANMDVLPYADIICTSLTKLFSGGANVMGGSLVLNPSSKHYQTLQALQKTWYFDDYFSEDAIVMEHNSRDYLARVDVTNANSVKVAEFLRSRSISGSTNDLSASSKMVIKDVFYPKWSSRDNYDSCRRSTSPAVENFGHLLALTFTTAAAARRFYDALKCAKGPNLGANFTIALPYTFMGHYHDLERVARFGLEETTVRVTVGMEEQEILLRWFREALEEAEKTLQSSVVELFATALTEM